MGEGKMSSAALMTGQAGRFSEKPREKKLHSGDFHCFPSVLRLEAMKYYEVSQNKKINV